MQHAFLASLNIGECKKERPELWGAVERSGPFLVVAVWWYQKKGDRRKKEVQGEAYCAFYIGS